MEYSQDLESNNVLVELSVVPLGSNGQNLDPVANVHDIVETTDVFYEKTNNGTFIEGEWNDICPIIYECYEKVQEQSPHGFLKLSLR